MKVGVLGSGSMGSGIAQIAATHDCETIIYDIDINALERSQNKLEKILLRLIEKDRITQAKKDRIQSNISYTVDMHQCAGCDMVIEAIVEDLDIKKKVFEKLEGIVSDHCIIASNTSSLSITSLAAALSKPDRFIGIHFFNPAPLMKLVEIVPAIQTGADTLEKARSIIDSWGKLTVQVKDTPGFIVNKVARPFYAEALRMFEEGIVPGTPEESFATIDWAMTEIGGFKMGPFTLMDFIGNDVNYAVTESIFTSFYFDPRYKPSFTQKRLAEAGYHGRKASRGYYDYSKDLTEPHRDLELGRYIADRIITMLINEAADTVHLNIAKAKDVDIAMTKGVNYPKGLLAWADEIGIQVCVRQMDALYDEYHEDRYRCSPLLRRMAAKNQTFFNSPTSS